jgi:hypothetical protein
MVNFLLERPSASSHRAERHHQDLHRGAVAFLPPTLMASIYGMNFEFMPECTGATAIRGGGGDRPDDPLGRPCRMWYFPAPRLALIALLEAQKSQT